jgi:hypothetical protein
MRQRTKWFLALGGAAVLIALLRKMNKNTWKWIAGVWLVLLAMQALMEKGFLAAAIFSTGAAVCIPPIYEAVASNLSFQLPSWLKYLIVIFSFVFGVALVPSFGADENASGRVSYQKEVVATADLQISDDSLSQNLSARLKNELKRLQKPLDPAPYRGSREALYRELKEFHLWGRLIRLAETSGGAAEKKSAEQLRKKAVERQLEEFPKMREELAHIFYKDFREEMVGVKCIGDESATLQLTGGSYSSKKTIEKKHASIVELLQTFRFKAVHYRNSSSSNEFTGVSVDSPEDGQLVKF